MPKVIEGFSGLFSVGPSVCRAVGVIDNRVCNSIIREADGEEQRATTLPVGRGQMSITDTTSKVARHKELKVARCRWEIIPPNGNYSHSSDMGDNCA